MIYYLYESNNTTKETAEMAVPVRLSDSDYLLNSFIIELNVLRDTYPVIR